MKSQREEGVTQAEMANGLLNVEQLFEEDLAGLSPEEEDSLKRIARVSPVAVQDLADDMSPAILQSLVDRRLLVRIGAKLDVYWDIFRDYLNTSRVPAQEHYLPRVGPRSVFKACKLLAEVGGQVSYDDVQHLVGLSRHAAYNVIHEMRALGLAKVESNMLVLALRERTEVDLQRAFRQHLGEKFRRNRLMQMLLEALAAKAALPQHDVAELLKSKCPYISAHNDTWRGYAETFCHWLVAANLAVFDRRAATLLQPGQEMAHSYFSNPRRLGGVQVLQVHYTPVETMAKAFLEYLRTRRFEFPPMARSTREKALVTLESFGFIVRTDGPLRVTRQMERFLETDGDLKSVLREAAMDLPFFKELLSILEECQDVRWSLMQIGQELRIRMNADWSDGTAQTTAKVALDWARHVGVAPGIYARHLRRNRNPHE